ncbi:MAG TPA: hypothetical protein PLG60_01860 [Acidimicrobiales bacterium]|nr:hypothetical protein [Acidimicrobiales bacterium]
MTTAIGTLGAILILASLALNAVFFVAASLATSVTLRRRRQEMRRRRDLERVLHEIVGPPTSKHFVR